MTIKNEVITLKHLIQNKDYRQAITYLDKHPHIEPYICLITPKQLVQSLCFENEDYSRGWKQHEIKSYHIQSDRLYYEDADEHEDWDDPVSWQEVLADISNCIKWYSAKASK